ncbi:PPC domain-containing DNA-binding protein [Candidatus Proelusimicrobium excrementi]|uniref:PPC domain-containing DNA-binding protein n=1 Tax=Candidatus Proelusimicrobium excrementi TaxID=3416222 RepID=UPI003CB3DB10|nr:DNA-binding protein [Elusimicrobiaceae bacterium]
MAEQKPYLTGRTYIFRIQKGKDLMEALTDFCHDNQIKCGIINGIGALENATLSSYDQAKKKYDKRVVAKPMEMVSLMGNVSIMDNRANVRADVVLADDEGNMDGGQLTAGTKVFVAEVYIQELVGEPKVRKQDKVTKLNIWI